MSKYSLKLRTLGWIWQGPLCAQDRNLSVIRVPDIASIEEYLRLNHNDFESFKDWRAELTETETVSNTTTTTTKTIIKDWDNEDNEADYWRNMGEYDE